MGYLKVDVHFIELGLKNRIQNVISKSNTRQNNNRKLYEH